MTAAFLTQFPDVAEARRVLGARWTTLLRWAADCAGEGASLLADTACENIGAPVLVRVLRPWGAAPYVEHWVVALRGRQTSLDDTETDIALGELANVERDLASALANPSLRGDDATKALVRQLAARPRPKMADGRGLGERFTFAPSSDALQSMNEALRWLPGAEALGVVAPKRELSWLEQARRGARVLGWTATGAAIGWIAWKVSPLLRRGL